MITFGSSLAATVSRAFRTLLRMRRALVAGIPQRSSNRGLGWSMPTRMTRAAFNETSFCSLAYDLNGIPIQLPPEACTWLVRKHRLKAPPQVIFRNGMRATLPIGAAIEDLYQLVGASPGRYRLVALDESDLPIEGVPEAHVEFDAEPVTPTAFVAPPSEPLNVTRTALASHPLELLLLETMRANTELARATVDRIPDVLRASAYLLQAADGAGLPRRPPLPVDDVDDDYDDDNEEESPPATSLLLDTFLRAAMAGGPGLGGLAKLLGVGVAPSVASTTSTGATPEPAVESVAADLLAPRNAAAVPPVVDTQGHLFAILGQLTPDERAYAERVFGSLSPEAVRQWHEMLLSMSVEDAVRMIRGKAAGARCST